MMNSWTVRRTSHSSRVRECGPSSSTRSSRAAVAAVCVSRASCAVDAWRATDGAERNPRAALRCPRSVRPAGPRVCRSRRARRERFRTFVAALPGSSRPTQGRCAGPASEEDAMRLKDIMTTNVRCVRRDETLTRPRRSCSGAEFTTWSCAMAPASSACSARAQTRDAEGVAKVGDAVARRVVLGSPEMTVRQAAHLMRHRPDSALPIVSRQAPRRHRDGHGSARRSRTAGRGDGRRGQVTGPLTARRRRPRAQCNWRLRGSHGCRRLRAHRENRARRVPHERLGGRSEEHAIERVPPVDPDHDQVCSSCPAMRTISCGLPADTISPIVAMPCAACCTTAWRRSRLTTSAALRYPARSVGGPTSGS